MSIPREFKELLLARIDLVDLINTQIPLQKKSGSNYFARCPFHDEKNPSFSVSQPKQFYYCFGCGAHGNAIDFMMQHDRLSFPEAIHALARIVGMEVPETGPSTIKKEPSYAALYEFLEKVSGYYTEQLHEAPHAMDYLTHRGISDAIAQQFHLGYAPAGWSHLLDNFGKTEGDRQKLSDTGMLIKKNEGGGYYDRFRDRIIFPIHDYRGRLIGFGGRIINTGEPKYLNSPETSLFQKGHELYGLYQVLTTHRTVEKVIIVEGYMDVIALFQQGITYAVATLGTATSHHHLQRLFRYTANLIFCFDGDEAGKNAAWRALQAALPYLQDQLQIRFLFLPDGEDPDSLIRQEGKEAFEKRIASASSLSDFFFQTLSKSCDTNTIEGGARLTALALSHIKQLPVGIFQTLLLDELSKRTRVGKNELKNQIHPQEEITPPAATKRIVKTPATKQLSPIRRTIALLIQHPELAALIEAPLPESQIPGYTFLTQLIEIINQNPKMTAGMLLEYWRGQEEEKFIATLGLWEHTIPADGLNKEFLGSLRQVILLTYNETIDQLMRKEAHQKLSPEEKSALSILISKKKGLSAQL